MMNKIITKKSVAENLVTEFNLAVKEVVPYINDLIDGFNLV